MLHLYSSQDLENLLIEYCKKYDDTLENVLHKVSKFSVVPCWTESRFVNCDLAEIYAPQYIKERADMLLKCDDYSRVMLPIINKYYSDLGNNHQKIYMFCNALIKLILVAGLASYREGTTSDGLGIAHIDFKPHFNQQDFNELIVHQITHFLLYFNDVIKAQVPNEYKNVSVKTRFQHKRGGQEFPLYILFHSFCVAVEVLQFRIDSETVDSLVNYHSNSNLVIRRCNSCIMILTENVRYFTQHGKTLLEQYIYSFKQQESLVC